jgi:hypothetical protein
LARLSCFDEPVTQTTITFRKPDAPPTFKQVYAIARSLCKRADEEWPETREQASELISRLREENTDDHG